MTHLCPAAVANAFQSEQCQHVSGESIHFHSLQYEEEENFKNLQGQNYIVTVFHSLWDGGC